MLDIKKIAALPNKKQALVDKVRSYPFYVMYGLGFDCEFCFDNLVSHFGQPRFIIDRAKGGKSFRDISVLSSLSELSERDYCIIVTAPSFASEIILECQNYVSEDAIVKYAGEFRSTSADYPRFLLDHEEKINVFYDLLEDKRSKFILETWLSGKVTKDNNLFFSICTPCNYMNPDQLSEECQRFLRLRTFLPPVVDRTTPNDCYFTTGLFELHDGNVFYDIGAAYGDTVSGFFEYGSRNGEAVAVELDPKVADKTRQFCAEHGYNARVINCGVADAEGTIMISSGNTGGTSIDMARESTGGSETVRIMTFDTLVKETNLVPNFIKMDIEGAELSALHGAADTIRAHKPVLGICLYHKPEDIIEIPQYILSLNPAYKLYLRHFSISSSELVLFAV